ncbi:type III secretion system protein [Chlamydia trachomatis]|uniref:SctQ family type III secretion system cytoplasmic ring protein CdsQ n=1 Tax=Chlamydia trachomatis TaxID=813 RepID=UPI00084C8BDB|nr:SctQ family type III secretion system cytoplasmic ring protein CdsQ [Chlamydia trachomatis]AOQ15969.1 type III secretion system protein [Chlamydia trachomatis]AOQ16807.1 type III secretion system protein [Chlamydia trachomatis]AOQ17653.1 type III secretion system protein [Chlamydia trachomatis]AOQ18535.1 type III secretion system protein [Chlamydia trachomatis]
MAVAAEPSSNWLKARDELLSSLQEQKEGMFSFPVFPKQECEQKLKDKFHMEEVELSFESRGLLSVAAAVQEYGEHILLQPFLANPFESGEFYIVSSEEDLQALIGTIFNDSSLASYFYEKDRLLGFHYYFVAEICKLLQESPWIPSMSVKVTGDVAFSARALEGEYHVIQVSCRLDGSCIRFSILVPETTAQSACRFLEEKDQAFDMPKVDLQTPITLAVEVGFCQISEKDWHQVVPGSFILLDACLYDPDTGDAGAFLSIQRTRFFGGRFLDKQSGAFKITGLQEMQPEDAPEEPSEGGPATPLPSATKIVAEVARYSLSVGEFLKLGPGSVLQFDGVHPTLGVDIILNGAKVGRGNIIALQDVLGIRVLEV